MKTAIYIEDGTVQLVLTPESEYEKGALKTFENKPLNAQIFVGSFYDCRGGWVRQKHFSRQNFNPMLDTDDRSLILRMSNPDTNTSDHTGEPSPELNDINLDVGV